MRAIAFVILSMFLSPIYAQETILIKGADVWNGTDDVLAIDTDVLIVDNLIVEVGNNIKEEANMPLVISE